MEKKGITVDDLNLARSSTDPDVLHQIAEKLTCAGINGIISNRLVNNDFISEKTLDLLARIPNKTSCYCVDQNIATHRKTSVDTLEFLAVYGELYTQTAVVLNPKTPGYILRFLRKDFNYVSYKKPELISYIYKHKNCPKDLQNHFVLNAICKSIIYDK